MSKCIDADKIEWYGCDKESECIKYDNSCNKCPRARCDAKQVRNLPEIKVISLEQIKQMKEEIKSLKHEPTQYSANALTNKTVEDCLKIINKLIAESEWK